MWYVALIVVMWCGVYAYPWIKGAPWQAHVKLYKGTHLHVDVGLDFWQKPVFKRQSLVHWTGLTHIYTSWYIFTGWGLNIWYCRKDK